MIITLDEAKKRYPDVTQADLDGIEQAIRQLTNNNFQNRHIRAYILSFEGMMITTQDDLFAFRTGQTIQVSSSKYSDGLYVIEKVNVDKGEIAVKGESPFLSYSCKESFMTVVEYPPDVVSGVLKLLEYDNKMKDKVGIKSITVARMTESYYDQNAAESENGYPRTMMNFIDKHRRLRWS